MLKKPARVVLASFRSSTYPRGYASGLHSLRPCWTAFLSILLEFGSCSAICLNLPRHTQRLATAKSSKNKTSEWGVREEDKKAERRRSESFLSIVEVLEGL
jgi:hypothetical protein